MTLQSELASCRPPKITRLPLGRLDDNAKSGAFVSRLEFRTMQSSAAEVMLEAIEPMLETGQIEHRLKEEIAALESRYQLQAEQMLTLIETARKEATTEVRESWEKELEGLITAERERVARIAEQFSRERAGYFASVEVEVVKLALAIAARVLHREVQLDPLLLAAAVRVALENLEKGSTTILRVPPSLGEPWRQVVAVEGCGVQVVEEERLSAGECVLETSLGRVDLGVSAQLVEIERGFFDLLQRRPA